MPLESEVTKRWRAMFGWTTRLSTGQAWMLTGAGLAVMALLDWVTGPQVSVGVGYLLLICFASWCLREMAGFLVTTLTVMAVNLINGFGSVSPDVGADLPGHIAAWNSLSRLVGQFVIVIIVSTLRHVLELERWRAATDSLTGALNKGAFYERMDEAIARARRDDAAVVLAYMDLDGFKHINDKYGHSAGDRVLRIFADAAGANIRDYDLFARIGGDEFVALLISPTEDRGDATAEILHSRISDILCSTGFPVTCSMGAIVMKSGDVPDNESMVALADGLMYEVKRAGKNALRIAHGDNSGALLRSAFPPVPPTGFEDFLKRIDKADAVAGKLAA